jgi:hypothetical protein
LTGCLDGQDGRENRARWNRILVTASVEDSETMESRLPELRELVDQLDRLVPKEGARLRLRADGEGTAAGTQRGYLRLGIEMLRAALAPVDTGTADHRPHLPLTIDYLMTPDSVTPFEVCEIVDDPDRLPAPERKLGALGQLMAALIAVVVLGLIGLGAAAMLSSILR